MEISLFKLNRYCPFRSCFGGDKFLFTYFAPKDSGLFYAFLRNIYNSSVPHSLYLTLSNPGIVRKLFSDMGLLQDTPMEIYIASNDLYAPRWFNEPLRAFIRKKNLKFGYYLRAGAHFQGQLFLVFLRKRYVAQNR